MPRALITGGSRGIGRATADLLVEHDWQVTDFSRTNGYDVTATNEFVGALLPQMGSRLNAIICCAGDVEPTRLKDETLDGWLHSLEVNLTHQWTVLKNVARSTNPPQSVVLVGSTAGTRPSPGWSSYSAAKAALHNLGLTAAKELERHCRVYVVAPGRCATQLRAKLAPDEDPQSIMQPAKVAEYIKMCLDDVGREYVGQIIEVKGP